LLEGLPAVCVFYTSKIKRILLHASITDGGRSILANTSGASFSLKIIAHMFIYHACLNKQGGRPLFLGDLEYEEGTSSHTIKLN
jgi:hypothetical protein